MFFIIVLTRTLSYTIGTSYTLSSPWVFTFSFSCSNIWAFLLLMLYIAETRFAILPLKTSPMWDFSPLCLEFFLVHSLYHPFTMYVTNICLKILIVCFMKKPRAWVLSWNQWSETSVFLVHPLHHSFTMYKTNIHMFTENSSSVSWKNQGLGWFVLFHV